MDTQAAMLAELFKQSLNLSSEWTVVDVEFREVEGHKDELHIYIERTPGHNIFCTACGGMHGVYDTREREWRHLDIWQYKTIIHCKVPRLECGIKGIVTVKVPWEAPDAKHFTALFEAQVILMARSHMTVSAIANVLDETDTRLWRIIRDCVSRAREKADYSKVTAIGVDETACKRGHNYISVFVDLHTHRVISVQPGRDAGTVGHFAEDLKAHGGDANKITAVTCDLSAAFASGISLYTPNARRIVDKFHLIQLFTKAIDTVRAQETRESKEKKELLKRSRWVWLKNEENLSEKQLKKKRSLSKETLKTARACAMKEAAQRMYTCSSKEEAALELDKLISWIMHSGLEPMKKVAKTMRKNREDILNYFEYRETNSILEGLNSIIQATKRAARGYRNIENFKAMIFLHLGKLSFSF